MKFSNDEPFQENLLEEQLDVLAQAEGQILASPESLAYHRLKQFHAVWAREEAQAIERVRQKLTSHASSSEHQLDNQASPKLPPVPLSATHSHSVRPAQRLSRIANALAAVLIVSLLVSGFVLLLHSRQPSTSGDSVAHAWHQIASPNLPGDNSLSSVSAATGNDAWAVGTAQIEQSSATNDTPPPVPLIEHWNGQQWKIVPTPSLHGQADISAVVDIAPGDAWLVGSVEQSTTRQALIEHWDGQQWKIIPSPNSSKAANSLSDIAALASDDIWVVGSSSNAINQSPSYALIEHWDGQQWKIIPSQTAGVLETLNGITAIAPDDVWAIGWFEATQSSQPQTLIEHWDGSRWQIVSSSSPGSSDNNLQSITVVSANDIWAVGSFANRGDLYTFKPTSSQVQVYRPLVEHWDGHRWQVIPSPNISPAGTVLTSITALGPDDIWVTGLINKIQTSTFNGLLEHWDGHRWATVSHPLPGNFQSHTAITSDPSGQDRLWIAGAYGDSPLDNHNRTLIETNR